MKKKGRDLRRTKTKRNVKEWELTFTVDLDIIKIKRLLNGSRLYPRIVSRMGTVFWFGSVLVQMEMVTIRGLLPSFEKWCFLFLTWVRLKMRFFPTFVNDQCHTAPRRGGAPLAPTRGGMILGGVF